MDAIRNYLKHLTQTLDRLPLHNVNLLIEFLQEARMSERQIFILGNGGSASTASHFACDLGKNTRSAGWPQFRVMSLTDNMAVLSAYANDEGYDQVFAQQLVAFVREKDIVIAISTSGNSPNVLRAVEAANRKGARTVGFTGFDGGQLASLVELHIHVDSDCIEQVEDIHLILEHAICTVLRQMAREELLMELA